MTGWRRLAERVALLLLCGAVANVAVAWGCVALDLPPFVFYGREDRPDGAQLVVARYDGQGVEHIRVSWGPPRSLDPIPVAECAPIVSPWQSQLALPKIVASECRAAVLDLRGWPMRSMWSRGEFSGRLQEYRVGSTEGLITAYLDASTFDEVVNGLSTTKAQTLLGYRAFPLGVVWGRFMVNTIFYAALLWLLVLAAYAARSAIRRHRGLCPSCGYDLSGHATTVGPHPRPDFRGRGERGVTCPECGKEGAS